MITLNKTAKQQQQQHLHQCDEDVHTVLVKSLDPLLFLMFLKEMSYAHQACIYLIKNTEKNSNIQQGCVK